MEDEPKERPKYTPEAVEEYEFTEYKESNGRVIPITRTVEVHFHLLGYATGGVYPICLN